MKTGSKQYCLLSTRLFLFVEEMLAVKIKKNNQNIDGIKINNYKIKVHSRQMT